MVIPALSVVVRTVPLIPEVELLPLPPVVEFEPPRVELLPPIPPTGTVEFEPAPPMMGFPEDDVPVVPAPATPTVVDTVVLAPVATTTVAVSAPATPTVVDKVVLSPVATTTVAVPVASLVAVTVAVETPDWVAATGFGQRSTFMLVSFADLPLQN